MTAKNVWTCRTSTGGPRTVVCLAAAETGSPSKLRAAEFSS